MKPHEIVSKLTELKQRSNPRNRDNGPHTSHYADALFTYAFDLAPGNRLGNVERIARTLDLLITELATYRERANTAPGAPLRTPADELPGISGDVTVTVTRGEPGPATRTALDQLAATLEGDWVIVLSSDAVQVTARPASVRPRKAPQSHVPGYGVIVTSGRS